MRTAAILLLSVALAVAGEKAAPGGEAPKGGDTATAKIKVDAEEYDFGTVEEGAVLSHKFVLTNEGKAPLKISDVRSSCSCTTPGLAKDELAPGESIPLEIVYKTQGRKGQQTQYLLLKTNDPARQAVRLTIKANVQKALEIVPDDRIYLPQVNRKKGADVERTISASAGEAIKVLSVKSPAEWLTAEVSETKAKDKPAALLKIHIMPNAPRGPFNHTIQLKVKTTKEYDLELPVQGTVVGDVIVAPSNQYYLGAVQRGNVPNHLLTITLHKDAEAKLLRVGQNRFLDVNRGQEHPSVNGRTISLDFRVRDDAPTGPVTDEIRLYFADSADPLVCVPVVGYIQSDYRLEPSGVATKVPVEAAKELARVGIESVAVPADVKSLTKLGAPAPDSPMVADILGRLGSVVFGDERFDVYPIRNHDEWIKLGGSEEAWKAVAPKEGATPVRGPYLDSRRSWGQSYTADWKRETVDQKLAKKELVLIKATTHRVAIKGAKPDSPDLAAQVDGTTVVVKTAKAIEAPFETTITVELDDPAEPTIRIPVFGYK